ncbi:universal stress protein [Nonomuraea sp. NPDC050536]|uniref:universal stress protein n=1 Tax=Nonomuraea sp. NPDC050536 TaxID=3364366 RepID=UPI0037C8CA9C
MEARGVVVGCDGSAPGDHALCWAADEAESRNLPLTLCHVWDWPYHEWPGEVVPLELVGRPARSPWSTNSAALK